MKFLVLTIAMAISFQGLAQESTISSDLRARDHEIKWDVSYIESYNEDANELEEENLNLSVSYL